MGAIKKYKSKKGSATNPLLRRGAASTSSTCLYECTHTTQTTISTQAHTPILELSHRIMDGPFDAPAKYSIKNTFYAERARVFESVECPAEMFQSEHTARSERERES